MATKSIKETEAIRQEFLKMRLERAMAPSIRALLNRMVRDFKVLYTASALIPSADLYRSDWEALLGAQYRRVGRAFIGIEQKSPILAVLQVKQIDDDRVSALIEAAFLLWSKRRAPQQASFILDTTAREFNKAIEDAKKLAPLDLTGEDLNKFVATTASVQLLGRTPGRVGAIANMETQSPAEQAKQFTARAIAGQSILPSELSIEQEIDPLTGLAVAALLIVKTWKTVGDEKVRRHHADADFQKRNVKDPFTVGGESLQYPGDTSLGATLGNTINCRCAAIYS